MKLDNYISELLYEHDCVVVPGFGGFVANYLPARIHPTQHIFDPPSKNILFNKHLLNNDGLLANKITMLSGCSYPEALSFIQLAVTEWNKELSENKKTSIAGVGTLYFDIERNLQFSMYKEINHLPDSFGLSSFHSPAIKRENISQRIEKEFKDRGPIKQEIKKVNYKRIIPLVIALPIFFLLIWIPVKTDLLSGINYSSLNPFSNKEKPLYKESVAPTKLPELSFTTLENWEANDTLKYTNYYLSSDSSKPITVQLYEAAADTSGTKAITVVPIVEQTTNAKYYLIAGCFKEEQNATKLLEKLKSEGYDAAIVDTTKGGLIRVCYGGYSTKQKAEESLNTIRTKGADAWLLSI